MFRLKAGRRLYLCHVCRVCRPSVSVMIFQGEVAHKEAALRQWDEAAAAAQQRLKEAGAEAQNLSTRAAAATHAHASSRAKVSMRLRLFMECRTETPKHPPHPLVLRIDMAGLAAMTAKFVVDAASTPACIRVGGFAVVVFGTPATRKLTCAVVST